MYGILSFESFDENSTLTVTDEASLDGGLLTFAVDAVPTTPGIYTLIDVADGGTLSIDSTVMDAAVSAFDSFDNINGSAYNYTLLQQDNDLILQVEAPLSLDPIIIPTITPTITITETEPEEENTPLIVVTNDDDTSLDTEDIPDNSRRHTTGLEFKGIVGVIESGRSSSSTLDQSVVSDVCNTVVSKGDTVRST